MKKKALALLFAASLLAGTLAGCGKSDGSAAPAQPAAEEGAKEEAGAVVADNSEAYNIEMQIVTWGGNPDEIDQVEAAINAIIEPEINATVTLIPIAAWDLANETSRALAAGEKLDLSESEDTGQVKLLARWQQARSLTWPVSSLSDRRWTASPTTPPRTCSAL